jgi:hypothetical protein
MWILTACGFYSVVQKPEDVAKGEVSIRARVRADLEALAEFLPAMGDIIESDDSDYRFRVIAAKDDFAAAAAAMVQDIDYSNFKSTVAERQGQERADVYSGVWLDLLTLQNDDAEEHKPYQPPIGIDAYPAHGSHSRRRG